MAGPTEGLDIAARLSMQQGSGGAGAKPGSFYIPFLGWISFAAINVFSSMSMQAMAPVKEATNVAVNTGNPNGKGGKFHSLIQKAGSEVAEINRKTPITNGTNWDPGSSVSPNIGRGGGSDIALT